MDSGKLPLVKLLNVVERLFLPYGIDCIQGLFDKKLLFVTKNMSMLINKNVGRINYDLFKCSEDFLNFKLFLFRCLGYVCGLQSLGLNVSERKHFEKC